MATFVETDGLRILIDPGASLAPARYGLERHPLEWKRLDETWETIKQYAENADVLIVTHYHYDHHDPDYPEIYKNKTVFIKHPTQNINRSQKERAAFFLESIKGMPKKLVKAIKKINLYTLVLGHHLLRDLDYRVRIKLVYEAAEKRGVKVVTGAEFCGRKIEMLEALRKELYA